MEQKFCKNCEYYRQHYTFDQRKIFQVYCGHCAKISAKKRKPDSKACECYTEKQVTEEPFVTKEYLSKALLEYILKMDLLPEIYNQKD